MQRACPSEADQGELSRIIATLNRDQTNGFLHFSFREAHNSGCEFFDRPDGGARLFHELPGTSLVEMHGSG